MTLARAASRLPPKHGGDLVWEIGTGYFGCRTQEGRFDPDKFADKAADDRVKMVEIKLSQGAKPGHGGLLPGAKVTPEIAEVRGVPVGQDVLSPASHSAFDTPTGLLHYVAQLRELSGGKPVGFKLCIGHRWEFLAITKAMLETGILPDFIVIDGAEGGTGAAPAELSDHVGTPLREGLVFAVNCLLGTGLRDKVKLVASGKIYRRAHDGSEHVAGRRLVQRGAGLHVLGRLRADQEVPHRPLPHRRRDAKQDAAEGPGGRGQGSPRLPLPPQYRRGADAVRGRGGASPSVRT